MGPKITVGEFRWLYFLWKAIVKHDRNFILVKEIMQDDRNIGQVVGLALEKIRQRSGLVQKQRVGKLVGWIWCGEETLASYLLQNASSDMDFSLLTPAPPAIEDILKELHCHTANQEKK